MKRRSFLKAVGLVIVSPLALAKAKTSVEAMPKGLCLEQEFIDILKELEDNPVPFKRYYYAYIHPDNLSAIMGIKAKNEYKHAHWVKRYNRWRASRGEPPYQEIKAVFGTFDDVIFME